MNQYPYIQNQQQYGDIGSLLQRVGLLTIFALGFWLGTQLYPLFRPEPARAEPTLTPTALESSASYAVGAQAQTTFSLPIVTPVHAQEVPDVQTVYPGPRTRLVLLDRSADLGGD